MAILADDQRRRAVERELGRRIETRTAAMDASGTPRRGVMTGEDMARWEASNAPPATPDCHGWTVARAGPGGRLRH